MNPFPSPLRTGHADLDDQHARMLAVLVEYRVALEHGNADVLIELLQQGLAICLEHWRFEEDLLNRTGWNHSIVACHLKEHERFESLIMATLVALTDGRGTDPVAVAAFHQEITDHMAMFDLPLVEAVARRAGERSAVHKAIQIPPPEPCPVQPNLSV